MHKWGRNKKLPMPLCECAGKKRAWFRMCHGTAQCCDAYEGDQCTTVFCREYDRLRGQG